ncbi:sensor histidine kinase [Bifidobacterium oedipodis]|uniref:histidine kinase n=1 Tax=Bifidobacterium oedipodis TaxID=2675322 RepID=A0A7Y0EMG7_9BIFI|nr:histidine kinase [Bifidobacterium sp. DSM 109957]NMM92918.1 two-component system sensor histidine kinase [Bifidobacterium sp. DSM 109957]
MMDKVRDIRSDFIRACRISLHKHPLGLLTVVSYIIGVGVLLIGDFKSGLLFANFDSRMMMVMFPTGVVVGIVAVLIRETHPLAVLMIEFVGIFVSLLLSARIHPSVKLVFLLMMYCCVQLPVRTQRICDGVMITALFVQFLFPDVIRYSYQLFLLIVIACGVASAAWSLARERRVAHERILQSDQRAKLFAMQRDQAERRSQLANELHDSIGHNLTAIASLSQGGSVMARTGKADNDALMHVFEQITDIARGCLDETRTALREFDDAESNRSQVMENLDVSGDTVCHLHDWDDIKPLLDRARLTGVMVVFTETGKRGHDLKLSDLCFAVTREAITNAMRHSQGLSGITVAWNHQQDNTTQIVVRDETVTLTETPYIGQSADDSAWDAVPHSDGNGLHYLEKRVRQAGGTLAYGPADGGWLVTAVIPWREAGREGANDANCTTNDSRYVG